MKARSQGRIGILFAAVATLGWALALAFAWVNASLRSEHERAAGRAASVVQELRTALEIERRASGGVAEAERRLAEGRAGLAEAAAERERAAAELRELREKTTSARGDMAALREEQARAERFLADLSARQSAAERSLAVAGAARAALDKAITERTRELSDSRRKLEVAREEATESERRLAKARVELAAIADRKTALEDLAGSLDRQATARRSELAELESRIAVARHPDDAARTIAPAAAVAPVRDGADQEQDEDDEKNGPKGHRDLPGWIVRYRTLLPRLPITWQ